MARFVPTSTETGDVSGVAGSMLQEQRPGMALRQGPRRMPFVFIGGFVLGVIVTAATNLFGRGRRMPFVLGNRNVFVSLPLSGITMAAPTIRAKNTGRRPRRQRGLGRWSRGMARSMASGAASGMARGVVRGRKRGK